MSHEGMDERLESLARALSDLGEAEGRSARPGLEDRVFAASRASLSERAPAEVVALARIGWSRSVLRIAAAVALLACAGVVAWSLRGGSTPGVPDQIVAQGTKSAAPAPASTATEDDDLTLIASSSGDDATRSEIDSLYSATHELDASLSKGFTPGLGLLEGGAM